MPSHSTADQLSVGTIQHNKILTTKVKDLWNFVFIVIKGFVCYIEIRNSWKDESLPIDSAAVHDTRLAGRNLALTTAQQVINRCIAAFAAKRLDAAGLANGEDEGG